MLVVTLRANSNRCGAGKVIEKSNHCVDGDEQARLTSDSLVTSGSLVTRVKERLAVAE